MSTAVYIDKFKIENSECLYQIFLECVQADPKSISLMVNFSPLPKELMKISQLIEILNSKTSKESQKNELFYEIRVLIEGFSTSNENK